MMPAAAEGDHLKRGLWRNYLSDFLLKNYKHVYNFRDLYSSDKKIVSTAGNTAKLVKC